MGPLCLLAIILIVLNLPELLFVVFNLSNASCLNQKVYEVHILSEKHAIVLRQHAAFFEQDEGKRYVPRVLPAISNCFVLIDSWLHT